MSESITLHWIDWSIIISYILLLISEYQSDNNRINIVLLIFEYFVNSDPKSCVLYSTEAPFGIFWEGG